MKVEGIDCKGAFVSTPAAASARLLAAVACGEDLDTYHCGAKQAFVQLELEEETYVHLDLGCCSEWGQVVLLEHTLYSLKDASRAWYKLFDGMLRSPGF